MKTKIMYATLCTITIYFNEESNLASADYREQFKTLEDALDAAEFILNFLYPWSSKQVTIWDSNTGEILAECRRDDD